MFGSSRGLCDCVGVLLQGVVLKGWLGMVDDMCSIFVNVGIWMATMNLFILEFFQELSRFLPSILYLGNILFGLSHGTTVPIRVLVCLCARAAEKVVFRTVSESAET